MLLQENGQSRGRRMWSENIHICRRFLEIPAGDQNRHTTDPVEKIMFILRGTGHRLESPGRFTKGRVSPKSFKEDVIYNLYSTFRSPDKRTRQKTRHTHWQAWLEMGQKLQRFWLRVPMEYFTLRYRCKMKRGYVTEKVWINSEEFL